MTRLTRLTGSRPGETMDRMGSGTGTTVSRDGVVQVTGGFGE